MELDTWQMPPETAWAVERLRTMEERARRLAEKGGMDGVVGRFVVGCFEDGTVARNVGFSPTFRALFLLMEQAEGPTTPRDADRIDKALKAMRKREEGRDRVNADRHGYATRRNEEIVAFIDAYIRAHPAHGRKAAFRAAAESGRFRRAPLSGGRGSDLVPTPCLSEDKIRQCYYRTRKQLRDGKRE